MNYNCPSVQRKRNPCVPQDDEVNLYYNWAPKIMVFFFFSRLLLFSFCVLVIEMHIIVLSDRTFFSNWFNFFMLFCCFLILLIRLIIQVYTGAWLRHYMSPQERMVSPEADQLGQVSFSNASRRRLSGSAV